MDRQMQQTTMAGLWQEAEAAARAKAILHAEHRLEMVNTLRAAAHTLGYSGPVRDSLFAFLNQVFERTNDGFGPPWWPEKAEKSILGWPGGPSCSRSKLFEIIADLRDAGILGVVPFQGDSRRSAYAIAWSVVYDMCGKPLPRYLADIAIALQCVPDVEPVHAVDSSVHTVDKPVHAVDCESPEDTHTPTPACAGARARFDLILDDEENSVIIKINSTDPVWDRLEQTADQLVIGLYAHCPSCPSLSRRTRVFLASVALLREVVSDEWVSDAVEAVQDFKAKKPPAYLHTCLQKGMAGHLPGGSPDSCEELLGRIRTVVSRWVSQHQWRPDAVVARDRAEKRKPQPKDPSEKELPESPPLAEASACDDTELVAAIRAAIAEGIGRDRYALWFGAGTRLTYDGDRLRIFLPNQFFLDWIRGNFRRQIETACKAIVDGNPAIEFCLASEAVVGCDHSLSAESVGAAT